MVDCIRKTIPENVWFKFFFFFNFLQFSKNYQEIEKFMYQPAIRYSKMLNVKTICNNYCKIKT